LAEVEARGVEHELSVLDQDGLIETELVSERRDIPGVPASEQHDLGRIARDEVDREEDKGQHSPEHGNRNQDTPNGVGNHR
jgi:hypothetical protein